jgi:hypothetical protein
LEPNLTNENAKGSMSMAWNPNKLFSLYPGGYFEIKKEK